MTLGLAGAGGGGSPNPPGKELGYAQITNPFTVATTNTPVRVTALSITFTPVIGAKYAIEFYCAGLDEDSGTTAAELVTASLDADGVTALTTGNVWQATGGVGDALYIKSPTQVGDGTPHTFGLLVQNVHNPADGVIIEADGQFPAYIRAVSL